MIGYVKGPITFKTPTYLYIECGGVGYHVNISLYTYGKVEKLEEVKLQLGDVPYRRARHVISENNRVLEAVKALKGDRTREFGELLYRSHASLRDDYEVSCKELDILVDLARRAPGIVGARMTGAGFGGCTVNLVESAAVQEFCDSVQPAYSKETGIQCPIYVCLPSAGAGVCG